MDYYLCQMYMYPVWVSLTNAIRKQLQVLKYKIDIYLDVDGVSFLSLNTTPLFGLSAPVLYMYFVEDGLRNSDKLTERFELKIKQ